MNIGALSLLYGINALFLWRFSRLRKCVINAHLRACKRVSYAIDAIKAHSCIERSLRVLNQKPLLRNRALIYKCCVDGQISD